MRGLWTILPVLGALAVGAGSAWAAETPQAAPTYQAQTYQSPEDQPFWTRSPSTPAGVVLPLVAGTAPLAWSNEYFEQSTAEDAPDFVQVAGGPPPWAPAHGYRRKHKGKDKGGHDHDRYDDYDRYPLNLDLGRCNRDVIGSILGGAAGAAVGSEIGDGKGRIAAIIGGSIVGILIGGEIGRSMDRADALCVDQVMEFAPDGRTVTWDNGDRQYAMTPAETYQTKDGAYCREYQATSTVGREVVETYGTACRQADGSWRIVN